MVVFRPTSFWTGVITAQSWHTAEILGPLQKIRGVTKKRHDHNNHFWGPKRIARPANHVWRPGYSFQATEIDIVAVSFFRNARFTYFFYWNLTWLWQLITLVRNHQILKTITFSESSGRSLSHGTTLYRSYLFIIWSYLHFSFHTFPDFQEIPLVVLDRYCLHNIIVF